MLRRCICAENRKLHASPIWLMFLILPIISAGYGTFNYLQNLEILTDGWYSVWTQHTLFYSMFFFPAMVAAYAVYLWRLEHLGHNWNLIMAAPIRPMNKGCGRLGRDLNSGWNCTPTNHGWPVSSTASTSSRSGLTPATRRPWAAKVSI